MLKSNLKVILAKQLKTLSIVSRETGISRSTLTLIRDNKSKGISYDTLDKLCNCLNCTLNDLFELEK